MASRLSLRRTAAAFTSSSPSPSSRLCPFNINATRLASSFSRPSPPKLPADQQAEFERLQRAASVSSAFQPKAATTTSSEQQQDSSSTAKAAAASKDGDGGEEEGLNQGLFRGAPPEFEGDVNPKTGEVGGPKNEPLRWGSGGDWSYNGRVTDF